VVVVPLLKPDNEGDPVKSKQLLVGAVLAVAALGGCTAPVEPVATPSATRTPSPSASSEPAASVVIGGTGISALAADGSVIDSAFYSEDAEMTMDILNDAFQLLPVLTKRVTDDNSCAGNALIATWGESVVMEYDTNHIPQGQTFSVYITAPSVGDVPVTTQSGVGVGASLADLETSIPGVHTEYNVYSDTSLVHYDVGAGEWVAPDSVEAMSQEYWGAAALSDGGTITRLMAPVPFYDAC
jgi:hypothetical protein